MSPAAPSRKQARRDALFILYQTEVTDQSMQDLVRGQRLREGYPPDEFTVRAVTGVLAARPAIDELIRYEERITQVRTNVAAIAKNLAEKIKIVAAEQKQLVRRVRERQIMEKLKERQNREWALYLEKKETAMLDEIAILRHEDHEG